jgi:hypothetical protein
MVRGKKKPDYKKSIRRITKEIFNQKFITGSGLFLRDFIIITSSVITTYWYFDQGKYEGQFLNLIIDVLMTFVMTITIVIVLVTALAATAKVLSVIFEWLPKESSKFHKKCIYRKKYKLPKRK